MTAPVRGVLVDLDDTLYPQSAFLDLAWRAVADRGAALGVDRDGLLRALRAVAAEGSGRGAIIDRALAQVGAPARLVPELLPAFREVAPDRLEPYRGVVAALESLRGRVPVAVVTDGEVTGQRRKLAALGLTHLVDAVVLSDAAGREHRKPDPRPFRDALALLGVEPQDAVMIGDRPDKDVAGAAAVGMRAVRVRTGEYAARADDPRTWRRAATFALAVDGLLPLLASAAQPRAATGPQGHLS